ncbi:MAG: His/Gly/Thr/Pro-type tRNA ligase C-terminal domain-containing protein, partial [Candidatus Parcubacteria bacterium]|nr:His/Gly/Thr/Pro-type tRNA ligase C-terminal domain-containing protein [Candidatus Parcubacteria bacterium]
ALDINKTFGFDKLNVYLSVRDPKITDKYIKNEKIWQFAEKILEKILIERKIKFQKDVGGAKFYGPAIDLKAVDAMGREWQGTTIQLDMNEPTRFQMTYIDKDGKEKTPIMLHRTLLGAMERFVATLIENCAGAFPVWLSPVQIELIPVGKNHVTICRKLKKEFDELDLRTEIDDVNETVGYKIRKAEKNKTPYILVIGDKEKSSKNLNVRARGNIVKTMTKKTFIKKVLDDVKNKK